MSAANLSALAEKPDHIPDAVVYDFDLFADPALLANPHQRILEMLQEAPPVFWTPRRGGHWIMLSYEANFNAARDTETFSSEMIPQALVQELLAQMPPDSPRIPLVYPIIIDPPLHAKYRQPLLSVFSPKTVANLEPKIRQLSSDLLAKACKGEHCEFMEAVAEPLPVTVFLGMLGLPIEQMPLYRQLVKDQLAISDESPEAITTLVKIVDVMQETIVARKTEPKDDLISMLWSVEIDGEPLTQDDVENYALLLFIAGLDTVINGLGYTMMHLAENQTLQNQLRADPSQIPAVVEEALRRYAFVNPVRRVTRDTDFLGAPLRAEDRVRLFLPAANLDEQAFPNASGFEPGRDGKAHIVFNAGPHRCLGSHLARLEIQIMLEELLKQAPPFSLTPGIPVGYRGGNILAMDSLPISWSQT